MAQYGKTGIFLIHTGPVVLDADIFRSPLINRDIHMGGTGIKGVFYQFLDNGHWLFNNFTSSNLVGCILVQELDFCFHESFPPSRLASSAS